MTTADTILLTGKDTEQNLVGVAPFGEDGVILYTRESPTYVDSRTEHLHPMMWATDDAVREFAKTGVPHTVHPLGGANPLSNLLIFETWREARDADKWARRELPRWATYFPRNPVAQYLLQSGKTLFKGMESNQLRRLTLDIEVLSRGGSFPVAEREEDEIMVISMQDSHDDDLVLCYHPDGVDGAADLPFEVRVFPTETAMLWEMVKEVHRRDPDVIVGHNIFGFDLPYLDARCELRKVPFNLGRDKARPKAWPSSYKAAERSFEYRNYSFNGRAVVDTMFLAATYDVFARKLKRLGLKYVAQHFGFAPEDRVYIDGDKLTPTWDRDPLAVLKYALDDVVETARIHDYLIGPTFYLTQMLPTDYQSSHLGGTAAVVEGLMVREYLRRRKALARPEAGKQEWGGLTEIYFSGLFHDLVYADVSSLYPNIMLYFNVQPESDTEELFGGLLRLLTDLRLATKKEMQDAEAAADAAEAAGDPDAPRLRALAQELDAKQQTYKININSFYGSLGFRAFLFNDISEADRVAKTGQHILKEMMREIDLLGGTVIECDTDGVIYVPREEIRGDDEACAAEVRGLTAKMPDGIEIDLEGVFETMLSYKKKNYVLVDRKGKMKVKGGSFKSRGIEPVFRSYIQDVLTAIVDEDFESIYHTHKRLKEAIAAQTVPVEELALTSTLKKSLAQYGRDLEENENNNPMAQYELALALKERTGKKLLPGDQISYYIAGDKPKSRVRSYIDAKPLDAYRGDENPRHYLGRLQTVSKKFEPLFSKEDFGTLFDMKVGPVGTGKLFDGPDPAPDLSGVRVLATQINDNLTSPFRDR